MQYAGLPNMLHVEQLPCLPRDAYVRYEGSIDKRGANADWDWYLYQDERGEWVIFDVEGPGCIYNFVQHRYISSESVTFRFYFDGEEAPRFTIRSDEFGEKYPFVPPLADRYVGPLDEGRGPIRVVRSFVPMPFRRACRVTSSLKLEGSDRALGQGGWGHIICHMYTQAGNGLETFSPDVNVDELIQQWKNTGSDPKPDGGTVQRIPELELESGGVFELFRSAGSGCIDSIRLQLDQAGPAVLQSLWIHAVWDGHQKPDLSCPVGCLFGNSLGQNNTSTLLAGWSTGGNGYCFYPMPYWNGASIRLENRGSAAVHVGGAGITVSERPYDPAECGYFRSTDYYDFAYTPGSDSIIGRITGRGKLVAAHITCFAEQAGVISCEGDVRVHIDGSHTPTVESDGSESHVCYGWGFPTPPESHPAGCYDGLPDNPWSMTRLCPGDWYPFYSGLRFGIESGENNDQILQHAGALFYYGRDNNSVLHRTDELDLGSADSLSSHKYAAAGPAKTEELAAYFEGDDDHVLVHGTVIRHWGSSFSMGISPENRGVILRRRSDQQKGRQLARILVDGREVTERRWYVADRNPHKRWLEDDFPIPRDYTDGKSQVQISIEPLSANGEEVTWNESLYQVYSIVSETGTE